MIPSLYRNVNDDIASGSSSLVSQATHIVNPLCVAAGGVACKDANSDNKLNLDELTVDQEKIVDKEILKNNEGAACTDNIDIDLEDQAYHNAGTMRYRKKTGSNNTDLDSIEHLSDDEDKKNDGLEDDIDSVSWLLAAYLRSL